MNKQYKVIWSKVRHCYVVVSELAKRSGKTKSVKAQAGQKVAVTLAVLALSLGMTGIAGAANNTAGSGSGVAVGSGSSASNASGVAIGAGATVNTDDGVAIGAGSVANVGSNGIGYIPLYTNLDGLEIFSPTWRSSLGAVSVGVQNAGEAATVTRQIVGVAAGSQDTDAVNVAQLKKLDTKIEKHRVHYFAVSTTDTDNNDNVNALGTDSMAIGPSARANVERSLAIGKSAKSYSVGGVALGADSYNIVPANMRGYIPTSVTLTDDEQTSPTWRSTLGAVAIGVSAENADGAITTATQTRQIVGVAAGTQDTDAVNVAQLKALGSTVDANKISFVSINKKSLGENDNENNDGATGDDAIAIGVFASATAPNATAMGQKAKATNYNSIALGDFANASGIGSTAVGDYAAAESHGSIAIGSEANATGMQSIALGDEAKGTGYQATVVGGEATASGINSLATGFGAKSSGHFSSSFGSEAVSDGAFATAIGSGANASAKSATALGESSTANIEGGVALGSDSKTNIGSGVLGYDPSGTITSQDVLLGNNKATYDNLQTEIATAQTNVTSLANQIIALQNEANTADETRQSEIIEQIKSLNTEFEAARADLQTKVSEANKLVSTWQATGAAVSVGDSETGLTRQITNVAAGTEDTDAVNVAQLNKLKVKVDKGWTLAVARGSDSKSENDATVEGDPKQINVGDTVTLEAGRGIKLKQDGAGVQIGLKYLDMEPKGDTYADAAASAEGALAVGQNSVASGTQGTAVGFANQATGKNSFAGGTEAVAGGDNSVAIGTNAITTDRESIAIGRGTGNATNGFKKVDSQYGVAIGSGAVVGEKSTSSVAIGGSAQVTTSGSATALGATAKVTNSVSGTAIGASATVSGSRNGTAIGRGAKVENVDYAVALGDQSLANVSAGVVGYDASGTDHTNDAAGTWKSGLGAVSVGKTGNTRQIINVAAGTEDTDAVNVAQLKAAGTAGLNFKGDGDTIIHRDLGATLNVVGGNTDSLTDNNIGVVADDTTGTLNVKLAKNLTMGDGSITFVPTGAKDANGNTLVQGEDGKWYTDLSDATYDATNNVYTKADGTTVSAVENPVVSSVKLTNTGLDNGGNKITNVAAGTEDTDIVNLGQLKGSMIKSSDVTYGADGSGTITLTMQDGSKVTIDSLKDTFVKEAKLENNTLTFTRNDDTSFEVGDIASKSDMDSAISSANLKFTGDDTSVDSTITKKNGEILNVLGGASEFTTANNIGVVKENDALKVKLAKNLTMGDGSITFAPTGAKDADGNTLVQGEDGKWYSDLSGATYDATNNVYTKADGTTVSAVENPIVSAVTLTNTGLDNGGNKITNVAAGTEDTDIVNLGQLKGSTIQSSKLEYTDAGVGTMTLTMQDGSTVEIGGLQDKYITGASLDGNKLTITRNDNEKFEVDKIATTDDIIGENSKVNLKFTGDDTSENGTITKINGATLNVLGGASEFTAANNIGVVKENDALKVKLAKDISMGDGSITFAPTGAKDADGNTLVQGEDGKWYSDLSDATYDATNNVYTKADGTTVSAVENPIVSAVTLTNTGLDNGGNKVTNVAAGTEDTDIVNLGQLKGSTIGSSKVEYTDAGVGTVTLTMQDGSTVEIGGLQDKYITGASLDGNKLTITRNDNEKFEVDKIATTDDIIGENSKVNLKFTGDDTSENGTITKLNGATLNVLGGASEFTTANNIGVVKENDALKVKLAKDISMGDGSITFAPTGAKDADGNTLVQGQDGKWYSDLSDATYDATNNVYTKSDGTTVSAVENPIVSSVKLTNTGLDNGGNKITNVAAGTEDTDIVNLGQLKGSTIGSSKVEYTDAGVGTVTLTMQDGSTVEIGGLQDKYITGASLDGNKLTITRNDNEKFEVDKIATTDDIIGENSKVNLKFTGDDTSENGTITKINGATLNVLGGATEFTTANNIGVVKDGEALRVKLAKDISMGDGSITFAPTGAKDADGNTLVQGQDGKWYSDLSDATYDATNNVYTKSDGTTVSAVENPIVSSVKLTNTGLDNGGNKITNVAAGTEDTDIVNLGQLKGSTIGSSKVEYTDAGVGTVTLTMQDGSTVEIGGLQDKYITGASLDGNKLTITRNDNEKFEVDKIATTDDIIGENSKVNLKFTGDDTSADSTITKKNSETLNILGGATEFTSANNIGVVKDGEALRVKLAKDISMGDGSITFAPTGAKDADGNTLVQGEDGKWYSDLSGATYDATNNVYTKADGTTVSAVENPIVSAVTLTNTGLDNGGNKITNVAAGTEDTDIVNLGQLKGSTIQSSKLEYTDAGVGTMTLTMQDGSTVEIGGLQDKYITGASLDGNKLTITRNDNEKFEVDKIATTDDIIGENSKVNLKFTGDDTSESGTITKINGATLNVLGGATEFTAANNIGVVKENDALKVKLAKDISMGDGSITFAPTGAKDADGNTLVQGEDGKWYSDLSDATYDATNNVYTKADGTTVSAVENPIVSAVTLTNTGLDNGGNKVTNVAAGTEDTDIVNLGQLKGSTIGSSKVEYTDAGVGTVTLTMQDGSTVEIGGLQDKYITGASLDGNKLTITRNDNEKFEVDKIATTDDIIGENSKVNLKFTGDDTSENGTITKINGATLNVLGGATEFTTANNIGVVKDGEALRVKLAKDISMGDGSITFAPTGAKDADGNTLVQGQDGKWYSDLSDATYDATNNVYTKSDGTTVSAVENPIVSSVKLTNTGLDNGGNKITNVAAGTEDTDIVNLGQLKGSTIGSSKVEYTDAGVGTVTLTMQDGSTVEIGGLQDKYITGATFKDNKLTITRNDDTSFEVGDIASKSEMDSAVSSANLKFTGDDTSDDATITKKNGETLSIYGGVAATDADGNSLLSSVNNVGVVKTDDGLQIKLAKDLSGIDSARIGGTEKDGVVTGGIYIANQSVTYNGASSKTESGLYVTGLANTAWNPSTDGIVSGRAATEDQLKAAYDGLSSTITANKVVAGKNITVTELPNGAGTEVALSDNLSFGDKDGNNVAIKGNEGIISAGDGGTNKVVVDGTKSTVTAGTGDNQVLVDGSKGQVTIGDGSNGSIVMGNQDVAVKNADGTAKVDADGNPVTEKGKFITGLENTTWKPDEKGYVPDRAATEGQLKDIVGQFDGKIDDINNSKRGFNSDTGEVIKRGKDDVLDLKGGISDASKLTDGNIGVVNNTAGSGFDIKLSKNLKDLESVTSNSMTTKELTVSEKANIGNVSISNDNVTIGTGDSKTVITNEVVTTGSVTTGNTTINNGGLTIKNEDSSKNITVENNNVSMGGNVIHNVGDAVEATDAINKGQFDRTVSAIGTGMNQMNNRIGKLDSRVNRVGAGAAALAALHPLEYSSDSKWEVTAGVGNYRGANAVALGAFYRPNYDTMVSIGSSYGGGENMVNAGVTWRIGEGETGSYQSKQAMAQEIDSLKSVVADQSGQLQAQNSKIEAQSEQLSAQNDKIEAQSQQLEEQNRKIEQLMQAIAALTK